MTRTYDHTPECHRGLQRGQKFDEGEQAQIIPTRLDFDHIPHHPSNERQVFDKLNVAEQFRYPRDDGANLAGRDLLVHLPDISFGVLELLREI